jgi:hypothetical protein
MAAVPLAFSEALNVSVNSDAARKIFFAAVQNIRSTIRQKSTVNFSRREHFRYASFVNDYGVIDVIIGCNNLNYLDKSCCRCVIVTSVSERFQASCHHISPLVMLVPVNSFNNLVYRREVSSMDLQRWNPINGLFAWNQRK